MFLRILLLGLLVTRVNAFMAYDCTAPDLSQEHIDLVRVTDCPTIGEPIETSSELMQLVSQKTYKQIPVYQCYIKATHYITYCGSSSHVTLHKEFGRVTYDKVSLDECRRAVLKGVLDEPKVEGLSATPSSVIVMRRGTLSADTTCTAENFNAFGIDFTHSYYRVVYEIRVRVVKAQFNILEKKLQIGNGVYCILGQDCFDPTYGFSYWDIYDTVVDCADEYEVIEESMVTLTKNMANNMSLTVATMETSNRMIGLVLKEPFIKCGMSFYATDHPKFSLVRPDFYGKFTLRKDLLNPVNIDFSTYVNTKFVLVEKHIVDQANQVIQQIFIQLCNLDREDKLIWLAHARTNVDAFVDRFYGPGKIGVRVAEVLYIRECQAVEVQIRESQYCYDDIPIIYNGTEYYAKSFSHIITPIGTVRPCNRLTPSKFLIHDTWVVPGGDKPRVSTDPRTLSPVKPVLSSLSLTSGLLSKGLYTQAELEEYGKQVMFGMVQEAASGHHAAVSAGYVVDPMADRLDYHGVLKQEGIWNLLTSIWDSGVSLFYKVGLFMAAIGGWMTFILIIISFFKGVYRSIFYWRNTKKEDRTFGQLFGSFFTSFSTALAINLIHVKTNLEALAERAVVVPVPSA